jgi:hypothetical protein
MVMHPNVAVIFSVPREEVADLINSVSPGHKMAIYIPETNFELDPIETLETDIMSGSIDRLT